MRSAKVFYQDISAGELIEAGNGREYRFLYNSEYSGPPVSLTMPVRKEPYVFDAFPPFFDGLLPEGYQLDSLLRQKKLDRSDRFAQLVEVGADTVGAVTVIASS